MKNSPGYTGSVKYSTNSANIRHLQDFYLDNYFDAAVTRAKAKRAKLRPSQYETGARREFEYYDFPEYDSRDLPEYDSRHYPDYDYQEDWQPTPKKGESSSFFTNFLKVIFL